MKGGKEVKIIFFVLLTAVILDCINTESVNPDPNIKVDRHAWTQEAVIKGFENLSGKNWVPVPESGESPSQLQGETIYTTMSLAKEGELFGEFNFVVTEYEDYYVAWGTDDDMGYIVYK